MLQPVGKAKGKRIVRSPFDDHAAAVIKHELVRQFAHWHKRLITNLHNAWAEHGFSHNEKTAKAEGDTPLWPWIDDVIDDAIDEPSDATMHDVADAMAKAQVGAADHTIKQIDLDDPNAMLLRINTKAVDYAAARGAELVGRRYDEDGNLIDNPDADWAITNTARNVLRREIRDSLATDRDVDRLADRISDVFSDDRAEMIARTEVSMAQNQGVLEAGRQAREAGLGVKKVWTLGPNPCPRCEDAAAEGDIDLEDDFGGDAGDAPPLHPSCQCELELVVIDEDQEGDEEEEESEMKHASALRFERIFKANTPDDDADDGDADHVVSQVADLLVETGHFTREQALHFLLRTAHGGAILARLRAVSRKSADTGKGFTMPTRQEVLKGYLKAAGGLDKLAAQIVKRGTTDIAEAEMVGMITATAQRESGLSEERAFSRLYTDQSPRGLMLRKAINICKAAPLEIMPDSTEADQDDSGKATAQMERLVDEQIRRSPEITRSAAWDVVVRENPALAVAAIRRPTDKMLYPFPRLGG
jgi:hypothetical protein